MILGVVPLGKKKVDEQKSHDECVRELAIELNQYMWDVIANVKARRNQPKSEFTTDIEARKGCLRRICEVLTEKDFRGGKQWYTELKNYSDEYDFCFYVVDKDAKRRKIDPRLLGKNY